MAAILVIEDDVDFNELIVQVLEDRGHEVLGAHTGMAAIEVAQSFVLDLVLSDVRMPGAVDGIGALEYIKKRKPSVRCIVMTGYADQDASMRALRVEVNDYLYKPFGLGEICEAVDACLESTRERSAYERFLLTLRQQPARLMEALERSRREDADRRLSESRARAFQAFFILVRAKRLSRHSALHGWDQLEAVEKRFRDYQSTPEAFEREHLLAGAASFERVRQALEVLVHKPLLSVAARSHGQVPVPSFCVFFDRIQCGMITAEQVSLAYAIRVTDPAVRRRDATLAHFYAHLWERLEKDGGQTRANLLARVGRLLESLSEE